MINQHDAKSITFENIQQTAEVTLLKLLSTDSKTEQMFHAIRLESLKHMAELKSTISWQNERKQQTDAMTSVAAKMPEPAPSVPVMETVLTPDYTQAPCPSVMNLGGDDRYVCALPFGHESQHRGDGMWWSGAGNATKLTPEPTKPAVDRLYELVSYCRGSADACATEAEAQRDVVGQEARKQPGDYEAAVFSELSDKLQDILSEGGI